MLFGEDKLLLQVIVAWFDYFVELAAHAEVLPQLPLDLLQLLGYDIATVNAASSTLKQLVM